MKISILTLHKSNNYGAVLQAYALCRQLENLGHNPEILDYHPSYGTGETQKRSIASIVKGLSSWNPASKNLSSNPLAQLYRSARVKCLESRFNDGFDMFRKNHLPVSARTYNDIDEIIQHTPGADAYICGSDQIWGPVGDDDFNRVFFLEFAEKESFRIAYAPSFGKSEISSARGKNLEALLSGFNAVSVRESSGADIVQKVTGQKPTLVLDPTLLDIDYDRITKTPACTEGYILVYRLRNNYAMVSEMSKVIKSIAKALNLPVLNISPHNYRPWMEPGRKMYPTPEEWIGLISNASFVITNSFHGTVFSIINKRPFLTFARDSHLDAQNDRLRDLLERLGIKDRYTKNLSSCNIDHLVNASVEWGGVHDLLKKQRETSTAFLKNALSL